MAYRFTVRAGDKQSLKDAVAAQLAAAVEGQPLAAEATLAQRSHAAMLAAANAHVDVLDEAPQFDIEMTLWNATGGEWEGDALKRCADLRSGFQVAHVEKTAEQPG